MELRPPRGNHIASHGGGVLGNARRFDRPPGRHGRPIEEPRTDESSTFDQTYPDRLEFSRSWGGNVVEHGPVRRCGKTIVDTARPNHETGIGIVLRGVSANGELPLDGHGSCSARCDEWPNLDGFLSDALFLKSWCSCRQAPTFTTTFPFLPESLTPTLGLLHALMSRHGSQKILNRGNQWTEFRMDG